MLNYLIKYVILAEKEVYWFLFMVKANLNIKHSNLGRIYSFAKQMGLEEGGGFLALFVYNASKCFCTPFLFFIQKVFLLIF